MQRNNSCSTFPFLSKNFTRLMSFAHSANPWIFTTLMWFRKQFNASVCDSQYLSSPEIDKSHKSLFHCCYWCVNLAIEMNIKCKINWVYLVDKITVDTHFSFSAAIANNVDSDGVNSRRNPEKTSQSRVIMFVEASRQLQGFELIERTQQYSCKECILP